MKTFENYLKEGIHDPGIFKAFFTAGGAGSGKSHIAARGGLGGKMGSPHGLVVINSDNQLERLLKGAGMEASAKNIYSERGQALRSTAKRQTNIRQKYAIRGRLGVLIDGTGKEPNKIEIQKKALEALGYDTYMLFVDTALEVAIERDSKRSRSLGKVEVTNLWKSVQDAKAPLDRIFGSNFIYVDNNHYNDDIKGKLSVEMGKLIDKPSRKREALAWINQQMKELGISRL